LRVVQYPDHPNLVSLLNETVKEDKATNFNSFPIYRKLTLKQLDELRKLDPSLINDTTFVTFYMNRLEPTGDVDLSRDEKEKEKYVKRLYDFVKQLSPAFNSYKATVLYNSLLLSQKKGEYDQDIFMEYIMLPRDVSTTLSKIRQQARKLGQL